MKRHTIPMHGNMARIAYHTLSGSNRRIASSHSSLFERNSRRKIAFSCDDIPHRSHVFAGE